VNPVARLVTGSRTRANGASSISLTYGAQSAAVLIGVGTCISSMYRIPKRVTADGDMKPA